MKLIASVDNNWAIGYKDSLLVRIPQDMKNFRRLTVGNTIVLGRKTLAGFPGGVALPQRTNIVLTNNPKLEVRNAIVVHSKQDLFNELILGGYDLDNVCVVGGSSIYKLLEPYCTEAILTKIDYSYQADSYFPNLDEKENWRIVDEGEECTCFDIIYNYVTYVNDNPLPIEI